MFIFSCLGRSHNFCLDSHRSSIHNSRLRNSYISDLQRITLSSFTMVSFRTTFLALVGAVAVSADYWVDPKTVPDYLRGRLRIRTALQKSIN